MILIIKRRKIKLIILIILIIFLVVRIYIDDNILKISSYEIESSKLPSSFDGYKILQLSDLHNRKFNKRLFEKIDKENPDIIVMTGDMVSAAHTNFDNFFNIAKQIARKYKVYYIKGNHEGRLSDELYNAIEKKLKSYGIVVLDNQRVALIRNNEQINLYGLWVNQRFYSRISKERKENIKKSESKLVVILQNVSQTQKQYFHLIFKRVQLKCIKVF